MGYVRVTHYKKTEYLTPEQFNDKLDYWEELFGYNADITESGCKVIAHIGKLSFEANKFGTINEVPSAAAISKELARCGYHQISKDAEYNDKCKDDPDFKERPTYGYTKHLVRSKTDINYKITWDYTIAAGIGYINESKKCTKLKCWSYDLNSSFPAAMLKPMPDTRQKPRYDDIIGPNEIGFFENGTMIAEPGYYAEIIFPLMESPFKSFIDKYYEKKKHSTGEERTKWKFYLNIATGILARHNIFLRNAVVGYANKAIKQYIDENTVYSNVDCIISTKERTDLPIGTEIGQFKQEKVGIFKYKDVGIYQWDNEVHYKGLKGEFLDDIEDISNYKTNLESHYNYKFNKESRRFEHED